MSPRLHVRAHSFICILGVQFKLRPSARTPLYTDGCRAWSIIWLNYIFIKPALLKRAVPSANDHILPQIDNGMPARCRLLLAALDAMSPDVVNDAGLEHVQCLLFGLSLFDITQIAS